MYESLPTRDLTTVVLFNQNVRDTRFLPAGRFAENNMPVNLFSDIHVRRAFAAAFDARTFTRDALQGFGVVKNTTLPPNNWADDKTLRQPAYNLKVAEAELRQAFGGRLWSTGFTIPIDFVAGSGLAQVVSEIFRQNIEGLNPRFHVSVNAQELSAGNAALLGGRLPLSALTWGGADPDTVLRGLYSAGGILGVATNFKDPRLETLLDQASDAVGQGARRPRYRTLLRYLNQQTYAFPLPQPLTWAATGSSLKGYQNFHRTGLFRALSK